MLGLLPAAMTISLVFILVGECACSDVAFLIFGCVGWLL